MKRGAVERRRLWSNKFRYGLVIVILATAWWGWNVYQSKNWIASTYPADGAIDVPRNVTIVAKWKGVRGNNLGMPIRYADAPKEYIHGTTGGSEYGMTFKPESQFAPGRLVKVTVEAGRRRHTFMFTTAEK